MLTNSMMFNPAKINQDQFPFTAVSSFGVMSVEPVQTPAPVPAPFPTETQRKLNLPETVIISFL